VILVSLAGQRLSSNNGLFIGVFQKVRRKGLRPRHNPVFWRSAGKSAGTARMRAKAARSQTTGIGANARGGFLMDFTGHESFPQRGCSRIRSIRPPGFATGGMTRTEPRRIALRRLVTQNRHTCQRRFANRPKVSNNRPWIPKVPLTSLCPVCTFCNTLRILGRAFSPSILPVVLRSGRLLFISSHTNDGCGNWLRFSLLLWQRSPLPDLSQGWDKGLVVPWRGIRPGLTPRTMLLNNRMREERIDLNKCAVTDLCKRLFRCIFIHTNSTCAACTEPFLRTSVTGVTDGDFPANKSFKNNPRRRRPC